MYTFAKKMKRKFTALSKSDARSRRTAKLKKLKQQLEDGAGKPVIPSTTEELADRKNSESGYRNEEVREDSAFEPDNSPSVGNAHRDLARPDWITVDEEQMELELSRDEETQENVQEETPGPEAPQALDPDQAQLLRDRVYYLFDYEDQTDYTEGPCRMADGTDGVKVCAVLLMTLPLSTKIQDAVIAQRNLAKAKRSATSQKLACLRFKSKLNAEIANRKNQIKQGADDDTELDRLEEELHNLGRMLEGNRVEEQLIKNEVQNESEQLLRIQERAIEEIEGAFVHAQLLPPLDDTADTPVEEYDLQKEYEKFVDKKLGQVRRSSGPGSESYTSSSDRSVETPTPEVQRKKELASTVWAAQRRYELVQGSFDRRDKDRAEEKRANALAYERGEETTDLTPEDFDLRWVRKIHQLTRELIEAESALSAVKAAAAEEGIDIPMDDRVSNFADDAADGYRISMEQAMIDAVPSPAIKDWVSGIPEVASPSFHEQQASSDADEWEGDEIQISDSVSMVAQDAGDRKRIDKWKRVCGIE